MSRTQIFKDLRKSLYEIKCLCFSEHICHQPPKLLALPFVRTFLQIQSHDTFGYSIEEADAMISIGLLNGNRLNHYISLYDIQSLKQNGKQSYSAIGLNFLHFAFPDSYSALTTFKVPKNQYEMNIKKYAHKHPQISLVGFLIFITKNHLWREFDPDGRNMNTVKWYLFSDYHGRCINRTHAPRYMPLQNLDWDYNFGTMNTLDSLWDIL